METSTASRLSKSDEDIISQFSCGSSAKYQTSQIMIKDMIKLIRHLCPDMSKSNQAMALSLLEFNFRSKFSFKEISNKLAQLLKQKTPFFSLFTALLSLLESPKERAIRILNEFRSIASKQLLVKVDWLEASIYENSFNSLNYELVELSRELDLTFNNTEHFVEDFIKIGKMESKSDLLTVKPIEFVAQSFTELDTFLHESAEENPSNTKAFLNQASQADFDIFNVNTEGLNVLTYSFSALVKERYSTICNPKIAFQFADLLAAGYEENGNPYHNSRHAADVMMSTFQYGAKFGIDLFMNKNEQFALFVTGAIHDYKHPGFNNNFFIRIEADLALRYNNVAPLENMHLYEAFKIIKSDQNLDIFSGLSSETYLYVKDLIIGGVLSTDVRNHNDVIERAKRTFCLDKNELKTTKLKQLAISEADNNESTKNRKEEIGVLINLMVHCADISNPTKTINIYRNWVQLVFEEFANQGKKEIEMGLQPSFLCESNPNIPRSQVGFMNFFVKPTFLTLSGMFPDLTYLVKQIERNSVEFQKEVDQEK